MGAGRSRPGRWLIRQAGIRVHGGEKKYTWRTFRDARVMAWRAGIQERVHGKVLITSVGASHWTCLRGATLKIELSTYFEYTGTTCNISWLQGYLAHQKTPTPLGTY